MSTPVQVDHYKVLGVSKTASTDEIKKAYRKLALTNHPDKGGDAEKFQEISHSYDILSDPSKKKENDNRGKGIHLNMRGGGMGMDFNMFPPGFPHHGGGGVGGSGMGDLLSSIFKSSRPDTNRTPDIKHTMSLSLEDMYAGKTCKLAISRSVMCNVCKGEGGSGKHDIKCTGCAGRGMRHVHKGNTVIKSVCMRCKGEGNTQGFEKVCGSCTSKGSIKNRTVVEAKFLPGCGQGFNVVLKGMSDYSLGKEIGDVIISALQKDHTVFKRAGRNLKCNIKITIKESLCGLERTIKHLDGRIITVKSDGITPNDHTFSIPGEGIPRGSGALEVTAIVEYPGKIKEEYKQKLGNILDEIARS